VEVIILLRYRDELTRRVLELGCGGGRVTGYLGVLSLDVHAIDLSPTMVSYCRKTYPEVAFEVADLRDLSKFGEAQFDVVSAWDNVLDILGDEERRRVLRDIRRILSSQGLFIMSSHNLAHAPHILTPTQSLRYHDPARLVVDIARLPRAYVNRRRLKRYEHINADFAILNDVSHDFRALHYYISRDGQARRFEEEDFELLDCLDEDGRPVYSGDDETQQSDLHYVARSR